MLVMLRMGCRMTKAVCIKCGALKPGALGRCPQCGHIPRTEDDLINSLALSDRHHDIDTLSQIGMRIAQDGTLPDLPDERGDEIRGAARDYSARFGPLLDHLERHHHPGENTPGGDAEAARARFPDQEWALVRTLPLQVFGFIAGADGKIDRDETNDLIDQIAEADSLPSPLHRAIMRSLSTERDFWSLLQHASNYTVSLEKTREIKTLLKNALAPHEYNLFMQSLFWSALEIAQSSGGGPFGITNPVSRAEQEHLQAFTDLYDFEPGSKAG